MHSRRLPALPIAIAAIASLIAIAGLVMLSGIVSIGEAKSLRAVLSLASAAGVVSAFVTVLLALLHYYRQASAGEARFRGILETVRDSMLLVNDQGTIVMVNDQADKLFGYARGELIGQSVDLLVPERYLIKHIAGRRAYTSQPVPRVLSLPDGLRGRRSDGSQFPCEIGLSPLPTREGMFIVAVVRDVSERLQAEQTLRQREAHLRFLVDHMPAIVWTTDTKLLITHSAGAGLAALNLKAGELIGISLMDYLDKDDMQATPIAAHMKAVQGESLDYAMEWLGRHFQVRVEPLRDADNQITGSIGVVFDITARKQAEESLKRSEQRYRSLIETARDMVLTLGSDLAITSLNPAFESITCLPAKEWTGKPVKPLVHADDWQQAQYLLQSVLHGETPSICELRLRGPKGSYVTVEMLLTPQHQGDEITGILGVARDITERKRTEEALKQADERLRQAHRIEAIGRLAGGVAHDFNNMLTIITTCSEMLLDQFRKQGVVREPDLIEAVKEAAGRSAALTAQLLAFSRRSLLTPKVFNLNAVATGMQQMVRRLIGEHIELIADLDPNLGYVRADQTQMEQVILNLAVNARDAMPNGGKLTLRTRNVRLDEGFARRHPEARLGECVHLAVSDNGCGMDEETKAKLFEPFFTTKEQGKGTGLGLAMVHGIVNQSEGYIYVDSAPGRGSTFHLFLPRVPAPPVDPAKKPLPPQSSPGSETILLAEDEEGVRIVSRRVLEMHGYRVLEARHGGEAMQIAEQHTGPIDLLITDMVMPQVSGRQLVEQLSPLRPTMKVLFVSGYEEEFAADGRLPTGEAFLQKPFTLDALTRKVRDVLDVAN